MRIHFKNTKTEKIFASEKELARNYGAERGRILMRRVSELKAARCLGDLRRLPQLHAHELKQDRAGQISISARPPYCLILVPANDPIPVLGDGGLDWTGVNEVTIVEVVDYH